MVSMQETLFQVVLLNKKYNSTPVLKSISFEIQKGDIFGIIGFSGAGKSTLLRCLSSLEKPTSGSIFFRNQDIGGMSEEGLQTYRRQLGMLFQNFQLFSSKTALENVTYPLEIRGEDKELCQSKAVEFLHLVGLRDYIHRYPAELSGGQKQRVGIARALVHQPKLLFCDEPTSALDNQSKKEILRLLKRLSSSLNLTILMITHEIDLIKSLCNKVAILDEGEIVEMGNTTQIFSDPQHITTQKLIDQAIHEVPEHLIRQISQNGTLLRLVFKGNAAAEPVICQMIRNFNVDANILMGWIDSLESLSIGTLIIELMGSEDKRKEAISYLKQRNIHVEEVKS